MTTPVGGFFFHASAELGVKSACFPFVGKMRAGTEMYCHSFDRLYVVYFFFFFFCPLAALCRVCIFHFYNRGGQGMSDCRGSALELPAARPWLGASCQRRRTARRYQTLTQVRLKVFSSSPFTLREVLGSVFKLNSHFRVTTTIFISSR